MSAVFFWLALAASAHAGLAGWLTSTVRRWDFIQETGGIRISEPIELEGKLVLPVEYDASGTSGITHRPTRLNSGLAVRHVKASRTAHGRIVIRIVTQIVEQDSDTGRIHYANLDDFTPGTYAVYYGDADDSEKFLGRIRVK